SDAPAHAKSHHKPRRHSQPSAAPRAAPPRSLPRTPVTVAASWLCPSNALRGVYHSYRLHVLGTCRRYEGTVIAVRHEADGDFHVVVRPSAGYAGFLDPTNVAAQDGGIVAEIMPGQRLRAPYVGAHVVVIGTWALDTNHGWNEIHPIWAMGVGSKLVKALPPITPRYQPTDTGGALHPGASPPPPPCS